MNTNSYLKDFFRAYKDFTDAEIDTIEIMLMKLYARFGIDDFTDFARPISLVEDIHGGFAKVSTVVASLVLVDQPEQPVVQIPVGTALQDFPIDVRHGLREAAASAVFRLVQENDRITFLVHQLEQVIHDANGGILQTD